MNAGEAVGLASDIAHTLRHLRPSEALTVAAALATIIISCMPEEAQLAVADQFAEVVQANIEGRRI